jgi:hypothetical protein
MGSRLSGAVSMLLATRRLAPPLVLVVAAFAYIALGTPPAARAATCGDYPNQAAAQRAANTRDADGDGIYCEDLPCPCLKPGNGGTATPTDGNHVHVGHSVTLAPVRKRSGCHLRGPLPDAGCTPEARYSRVSKAQICRLGYASSARHVTESTKDAVYGAYGMRRHFNGADGEVDHVVSLELGGSNAGANLFPEAATPRPGAHEKDRLENRLHAEVCSSAITLRRAQRLIARDWVAAYHARFG